jgi:hypothetical protein
MVAFCTKMSLGRFAVLGLAHKIANRLADFLLDFHDLRVELGVRHLNMSQGVLDGCFGISRVNLGPKSAVYSQISAPNSLCHNVTILWL